MASAEEDGVFSAAKEAEAVSPAFLDALSVPDEHAEEEGQHCQVQHADADGRENAEAPHGNQRSHRPEVKSERVCERCDRNRGSGMLHGLLNALFGGVVERRLVDRVAEDKHVVDADAEEQEGDQVVDTGHLLPVQEADSEAGNVGENYSEEAEEGDYHAAVDGTTASQERYRVGSDH